MDKVIIVLFISLILGIPGTKLHGQSFIVDSLEALLEQPGTETGVQIEAMERMAKIKAAQNQLPQALEIAERALQLSFNEAHSRYPALVYSALSALYVQGDSLKRAFLAADSAEWYAAQSSDTLTKARVRFRRGWLEHRVEDTDQAYQHMLEALRMLEGQSAPYFESNIYHYLAAIQGYWGNTDKQLHYTRLCLNRALKSGDPDAISNAYLSMGSSCLYRYRKSEEDQALLDSAQYFYSAALAVTEAEKDRITIPATRGIAALNMANLYYEFHPVSYKDSAHFYLNIALETGRKFNRAELIANSYGILSEYALKESNYERAETLLQTAMTEIMDRPGGSRYKSRISDALARVAERRGDPSSALKYYKQHMQYDKQVFDEEKLRISQGLEAQYGAEKKALALEAARQEAALNKQLNRYYLILILAGIVALFFLFRAYHFKIKSAQQKHLLLTGEKHEAELRANLQAEEAARLKAERTLTQERLERLEKELLAGSLQVEEKNRMLNDLQETLGTLGTHDPLRRQMSRLIAKSQQSDKDYQDIRAELSEVHPAFITGLQDKSGNKLTRLDLKYCTYILMGLSNKEIAYRLNVDPKSIRMARYRLKQKLKLGKEEVLDQFISNMGEQASSEGSIS